MKMDDRGVILVIADQTYMLNLAIIPPSRSTAVSRPNFSTAFLANDLGCACELAMARGAYDYVRVIVAICPTVFGQDTNFRNGEVQRASNVPLCASNAP